MNVLGFELNWIALAFLGMVFAALTNYSLSSVIKQIDFSKVSLPLVAGFIVAFAVLVFGFVYLSGFDTGKLWAPVAMLLLFSALAFIFSATAFKEGKVALVTAVLGLAAVFLAILTAYLGESFSLKEMAALLLGFASIAVLVF